MLTYESYSNVFEPSTTPLDCRPDEASLRLAEADAIKFFLRMMADVSVLTTYVGLPLYRGAASRSLGTALMASPADRTSAWRDLHVRISCLLARCSRNASPETFRGELAGAFGRLQQFVSENVDLARA